MFLIKKEILPYKVNMLIFLITIYLQSSCRVHYLLFKELSIILFLTELILIFIFLHTIQNLLI